MLKYKEDIINFILSNRGYRLHYSDRKFFNKIKYLIDNSLQVTTGQSELLHKLIDKYYNTSFKSTGMAQEELKELPWKIPPLKTSSEFTTAKASIIDNKIVVQCPFKSRFVNEFIRVKNSKYSWHNKEKSYIAPYTTYQLKILVNILQKHFEIIDYCPKIKQLLTPLNQYDGNLIWQPTVKKVGNHFYIGAINQQIFELTTDMIINDSPEIIHKLSLMAVDIDSSLKENPFINFVASNIYTCDISEFNEVVKWMKQLGIKNAILGSGLFDNKRQILYTEHVTKLLHKEDILLISNISAGNYNTNETVLLQQYGNSKTEYFGKYAIAKSIYVQNSYIEIDTITGVKN